MAEIPPTSQRERSFPAEAFSPGSDGSITLLLAQGTNTQTQNKGGL